MFNWIKLVIVILQQCSHSMRHPAVAQKMPWVVRRHVLQQLKKSASAADQWGRPELWTAMALSGYGGVHVRNEGTTFTLLSLWASGRFSPLGWALCSYTFKASITHVSQVLYLIASYLLLSLSMLPRTHVHGFWLCSVSRKAPCGTQDKTHYHTKQLLSCR